MSYFDDDDDSDYRRRHPKKRIPVTTLFLGILATVFAYEGDLVSARTSQLSAAFDRIATLEQAVNEQRMENQALRATVAALTRDLSGGADPLLPLKAYMRGLRVPAWLKRYNEKTGEFEIEWINPAYEREYDTTLEYYRSHSDRDVHGDVAARLFQAHDRFVFERRGWSSRTEQARNHQGVLRFIEVWKWYVPLFPGQHWIAGIQYTVGDTIDEDNLPPDPSDPMPAAVSGAGVTGMRGNGKPRKP